MEFPLNWGGLKCRPGVEPQRAGSVWRRIIGSTKTVGLAVACALLLPACSAIKVAYNQAPELGYWYLDSYFDFNGAQSLQVKEDIASLQAWHRQTQLPAYVESLQKVRALMPQDITTNQACGIYTDVRGKLLAITGRAEPAMVGLVGKLQPAQLTHLKEKFAKGDAEFRDDYIDTSAASARNKRHKMALKRAEMLYGRLDEAQIAVLNRRVDNSVFDAATSLAERQRRQQDVLQTLAPLVAGQAPSDKIQVAVHGLQERMLASPDVAHRAYLEKLTQDACQTFAELHNSTTPTQRAKAVEVLDGYAQDFKLLNQRKT